ncbi:MAG: nuclear transport factor 2 family protein [Alphaproteobacteria bacterium]|nr:nuclear transport factor 2 family protein [Alphaproteobacteria bacterium]
MTGSEDVLAANGEFYRAFAAGDLAAMTLILAEASTVTCIHPGWRPIFGREKVLKSWREIFTNPPPVLCHNERVIRHGGAAVVLCEEVIGEMRLAATNIFVLEADSWRLVHHQASLMTPSPEAEAGPSRELH